MKEPEQLTRSDSLVPTPDLYRVRRQVMSNEEADGVARYIELLQERVRVLSGYVKEAAGDQSCLLPISTLSRLIYLTNDEIDVLLWVLDPYTHAPEDPGLGSSAAAKLPLIQSAHARLKAVRRA